MNWSTSQSRRSDAAGCFPSSSQISEAASTAAIQVRTIIRIRIRGAGSLSVPRPRCSRICSAAARRTSSTIVLVRDVSATLPPRSSALKPASCSSTKAR